MKCRVCNLPPSSAAWESRWSCTLRQRTLCRASAAGVLATRSETEDICHGASRVADLTSPVNGRTRVDILRAVAAGVTTQRTSEAREATAALAKPAPERGQKNCATGHPTAPKAERVGPLQCTGTWARGRTTLSEGGTWWRPPPR